MGGANRAIVNKGWLTSAGAARASWWTMCLTKPRPPTHLSAWGLPSNTKVSSAFWLLVHRCDHGSVLASADWCRVQEEKGAKKPSCEATVLICSNWMSYDAGVVPAGGIRPFHQRRHVMFGSLKRSAGNCAAAESLRQVHSLFKCPVGKQSLTQWGLLCAQIQILMCGSKKTLPREARRGP